MKHFFVYFFIVLEFLVICSCGHDIDTKLSETNISNKIAQVDVSNKNKKYDVLLMLKNVCIKNKNYVQALCYSDSIARFLGKNYHESQKLEKKYYMKLSSERAVNEKLENSNRTLERLIVSVILFFLIVSFLELHGIFEEKKVLRYERTKEEHISEKLKNKESQLNIMKNFLNEKVDVYKKLEKLKEEPNKHVALTQSDWNDISVFLEVSDNLFVTRIKKSFPSLCAKDVKLLMLIRLKLSTKILPSIYGISEKSVKQNLYLFKKKVGLMGKNQSLRSFVGNF